MAAILYKWLMIPAFLFWGSHTGTHPIFVSVIEMEHHAKKGTIELTCRIFTDDFEKTLREVNKGKIDLLLPSEYEKMCPLVSGYIKQHLKISVNGKLLNLQFKGYEEVEEAIYSYFEIEAVPSVQTMDIENDILYTYKKEQMSIIHLTVNGERKSTKLMNPDKKARIVF